MAAVSINARVQKHRDALRMAGLRPVQIWVPDTRRPDFAAECRRQSQIASQADLADPGMQHFMDAALADLDGWTDCCGGISSPSPCRATSANPGRPWSSSLTNSTSTRASRCCR